MASGNNTQLSREMIRRTVLTRLDAKLDAPWERTEFRHPNLLAWAKTNRGRLIAAALTLCQAWIRAGRLSGQATLGMFESWAAVIGGILEVARAPGLLANSTKFRGQRSDQANEWREFVSAWWSRFAGRDVGTQELFALATEERLLSETLGDKGERSQRTRLGRALGKMADRVIGGYELMRRAPDHRERQQFRLQQQSISIPPATLRDEEVNEWSP